MKDFSYWGWVDLHAPLSGEWAVGVVVVDSNQRYRRSCPYRNWNQKGSSPPKVSLLSSGGFHAVFGHGFVRSLCRKTCKQKVSHQCGFEGENVGYRHG